MKFGTWQYAQSYEDMYHLGYLNSNAREVFTYRIKTLIREGLNSNLYDSVIVSGLDRSGKTTFLGKELSSEFNVYKSNQECSVSTEYMITFKLFDRHPYLESLVYDGVDYNKSISDELAAASNRFRTFFKDCAGRVLFVLFLDAKFRNKRGDADECFSHHDEEVVNNYLKWVFTFIQDNPSHGCVILDKDGIKTVNLNSKELATMGNNDKLIEAANNYYNGRPTGISDEEYDELLQKAKDNDSKFNIFDHVKYEGDDYIAINHTYKFEPLAKIKTYPGFNVNSKLVEGDIVIPKYDGCSIRAYYNPTNGELIRIMTRSNEVTGIIQTEKLRNKVPNKIHEGIITIDFEALTPKEAYGDSCRMKSNGLINSKYLQDEVDENVRLVPFKVTFEQGNSNNNLSYLEQMSFVFKRDIDFYVFSSDELNSVSKAEIVLGGKTYPIDGFVVRGIEKSYIFKYYYTESRLTTIRKINWNKSAYGFYIPKAEFDMVRIGGSNVRQSSVGSVDNMIGNGLGVGAEIEVILSGLTIPKIVRVSKKSTINNDKAKYCIPNCIHCNKELTYHSTGYYCTNDDCIGYKAPVGAKVRFYLFQSHVGRTVLADINFEDFDNFFNTIRNNEELREIFMTRMKEVIEKDELINHYMYLINISRFSGNKVNLIKNLTKNHLDFDEVDSNINKVLSGNNRVEYNVKHKSARDAMDRIIKLYNEFINQ